MIREIDRRPYWPSWAKWLVIEYSGKVQLHECEPVWCAPGIWLSNGKSEEWRRIRRIGGQKAQKMIFKISD